MNEDSIGCMGAMLLDANIFFPSKLWKIRSVYKSKEMKMTSKPSQKLLEPYYYPLKNLKQIPGGGGCFSPSTPSFGFLGLI